MKKYLAIPLLLLYLAATWGAVVQVHYCDGNMQSWQVNTPAKSCCCERSQSGEASFRKVKCCTDKVLVLKLTQDQNTVTGSAHYLSFGLAFLLPPYPAPVFSGYAADCRTDLPRTHAPPGLWENIPLYKLHKRLVYYG